MFEVKNITTSYEGEVIINNISFSVEPNNIVGIIGPNGAGKSTLIKSILNLVEKDSGEVLLNNREISYIPQRSEINLDFPITVIEVVLMGLYKSNGLFKKLNDKHYEKALKALDKVGMTELKDRQIGKLSGGQQQRVFLARALVQESDILFLDEPFIGIDVKTEELIIEILKDLKKDNKIIFVVHHDLSKVNKYFDELLIINKELIAYGDVGEVFTEDNMYKAYNFKLEKGVL